MKNNYSLLDLIDYYQDKCFKSSGTEYVIANATLGALLRLKKKEYSKNCK